MAIRGMLIMQLSPVGVLILVLLLEALAAAVTQAFLPQAKSGCTDHCGSLTIQYPFGVEPGCYKNAEAFSVICNTSTEPPTLMWGEISITGISLAKGEMQIMQFIAKDCYDRWGVTNDYVKADLWVPPPFTISHTKNKFVAVGCDTYAVFRGYREDGERYTSGCLSICDNFDSVEKSCSGIGCCRTEIPSGLKNRTVTLDSYSNHTSVWNFNPCSYAFIVEEAEFTFSPKTSFKQLENTTKLPMILNWEIGEGTCEIAKKRDDYACKAKSSKCINRTISNELSRYFCQCLPGYDGNPYLPDGCQDIDECKASNSCTNGTCVNSPGDYSCLCNEGFIHDGVNNKSCIQNNSKNQRRITLLLKISLGLSGGFLVLLVGILWICWGIKKRQFSKLKEKYFKENGGFLLLQQLASHGSSMETTKIFTSEELKKATNNYHESRVLGEGGYGTVYKGILPDDKVVAIKKSKGGALTQSDQFVNEVIVLSKINHRNVVKLLGCCLETEVPLLVYEFITHGTLYEHIHKKRSPLSFDLRMKIAVETAEALAHLHSSISTPIIHRDVKAANILLDDNYTAKVSDFGASRLVPSGQTEIQTLVLGTFGYLDPEYLQSNQLTEKSDVYSFGVVLVELLTSKVPVSKDRCLASIFVASMEEDWLNHILDDDIVNERNIETVKEVANLAKRCLRVKGEERPTMKEVAKELEEMSVMAKHPWGFNANFCGEENEYLLGSLNSDAYVVGVGGGDCSSSGLTSGTTNAYDSMQNQLQLMPYGGVR